jgi:hypothetical protein
MRIGILAYPDQVFEQWELSLFERLDRHPSISIEAFLTLRPLVSKPKPSLAFRALSAIEKYLFLRKNRSGSQLSSATLRHISSLPVGDLETASGGLDVVISHIPCPNSDDSVGYGDEFWEYHFYAHHSGLHETFGFHESLEALPVTESALLRRNPDGSSEVLAGCTTNTKFSASLNANYAKDMLASLVERELVRKSQRKGGHSGADSAAIAEAVPQLPEVGLQDILRYGFHLAGRMGCRLANIGLARLGGRPDNWSLVVSQGDVLSSPLDNLIELPQPNGESRADPFLFSKDGEQFVFFESWGADNQPARICVGRMDGGQIANVTALDLGTSHVSYPFVFEDDGDIFMIPETYQRDRVEIWRCTDFPGKWMLHATALDGERPADTVLIKWDEQWWMFTNLCSGSIVDHCMELHVYRVDGPDLKHIEPHRLNPVVLDTTSARNAGRPFVRDGRLVRPAQITSHGLYGYGLRFMEITELSLDEFSETEIRRIEPDRNQATTGCHHLDSCEGLFIMDVRRAYGSKLLGARPIALRAS